MCTCIFVKKLFLFSNFYCHFEIRKSRSFALGLTFECVETAMVEQLPEGVFPFHISDTSASRHGLKNGPELKDLVDRKNFTTAHCLQDVQKFGFMSPWHPIVMKLKESDLKEFVVACDITSKYGEIFLLLHSPSVIETFRTPHEVEVDKLRKAKEIEDANKKADELGESAHQKRVFGEEYDLIVKPYEASFGETEQEIEALNKKESHLTSPSDGNSNDFLRSEAYIQNAPYLKPNGSQTIWHEKMDSETQYVTLEASEFGINDNDALQEKLLESLKRVTPFFEEAFMDNELFDIHVDYVDIPDKGDISIFRSDDDTVKALGNYTDIVYSKGRAVQYLDIHPTQKDIVAISICNPGPMDEIIPTLNTSTPAYVIVWQYGQIRPRYLLKAPLDCTVFRFNPTQPHLVVGGCRNGTILLWDTSNEDQNDINPPIDYTEENNGEDEGRKVILPLALSLPEHGHKQMVADLCWLPAHIQINTQGQLLDNVDLSGTSSQFFTVSGDGQILFWDVRYKEIMAGKLPHVAKVKQSKQTMEFDKDFPMMKWVPLFKIKPKRLEGSGELSLSRVVFPGSKPTEIICASEEGDLVSIDWCPESGTNDGNEKEHEFSSQDYVQWMARDHDRPSISLSLSNFFPDFALTVSDWNFHIWHIDGSGRKPVYESPNAKSLIACGQWSPTRPGVIYISKADGSIDVWDFVTNGCYSPHTTMPLVPNCITAMNFTSSPENNIIAVGDKIGSLHLFELPRHLVHPYPNERR